MSDLPSPDDLASQIAAELEAMQMPTNGEDQPNEEENQPEYEGSYPSEYISPTSPAYLHVSSLWSRFTSWVGSIDASSHLSLNPSPAEVVKMFAIQEELAQGVEDWSLPEDVLASFACHDGQGWSAATGIMGRWHLLDCQTMFTEWRDQKEMMEMGLYTGPKYTAARKAQPRHPRIDTSYWFNPGWIPIACSRGANLGGDLICIDMAPILNKDRGQIILYLTESAERILLADSFSSWLEKCIGHLEAGVYQFDTTRRTYVAGTVPKRIEGEEETKEEAATTHAATATAASSSSSSKTMPNAASNTIGVEAFMYSALEERDFFIKNQTEALVYLPDNDFDLLSTAGLTGPDGMNFGF